LNYSPISVILALSNLAESDREGKSKPLRLFRAYPL